VWSEIGRGGDRIGTLERLPDEELDPRGRQRRAESAGKANGSPDDVVFPGIRRPDEGGQNDRLRFGEPSRILAEESSRGGADAPELPAEIDEVEVRLKDLPLPPGSLKRQRLPGRVILPPER